MPFPIPPRGPEGVGRLAVQSLGSPAWGWGQGDGAGDKEESGCSPSGEGAGRRQRQEQQLVSFVLQLRQTLQDTRCSAMVTCPAGGFDGVGGGVKGTREWTACPAGGFDGVCGRQCGREGGSYAPYWLLGSKETVFVYFLSKPTQHPRPRACV